MKKRFLIVFLALVAALCIMLTVFVCGCNAHTHDWGEWTVVTPATCSAQGEEERVCKLDSTHKETRKIAVDPNAHVYNTDNVCSFCNTRWEYTENLAYELNEDNNSYSVKGIGTATASDIVIPYYYQEKPVTSIGSSAFNDCTSLTSITIPASVTSIGKYAFSGRTNLNKVYITDLAAWCNINFYDSSSNPLYYAHNLYINGELATEIEIPSTVTEIKARAFYGCRSLTNITIPASVTSIGDDAFKDCSLTSITIPAGITSIGDWTFYNCTSLTSITIPAGITSISEGAFEGCTSLTSITFAEGSKLETISEGAFGGCTSLTSITIPAGITSISEGAFEGCTSLTSITFAEGSKLETIGESAFEDCTSLTSITIPEGVTSIDNYAFYGCSKLVEVINLSSSITLEKGSEENGWVAYNALRVVNGKAESILETTQDGYVFIEADDKAYLVNYIGAETALQLPESYKGKGYEINDYAFRSNDKITSIIIPASVTSIGDYAFEDCYKLVEVINLSSSFTLKKGKSSYGYVAYYALRVVNENAESILETTQDGYVFIEVDDKVYLVDYKGEETALQLPESYKGKGYAINDNAFWSNDKITSVTIPACVASIGDLAFSGCTSLTSITIPASVTFIGSSAFSGCTNLTSITFAEGSKLETIGVYAFSGCTSLTSITIPASVTSIGGYAFCGCTSLTSVEFENKVGWKVSQYSNMRYSTNVDVTNPAQNAIYLTDNYYTFHYWKRG